MSGFVEILSRLKKVFMKNIILIALFLIASCASLVPSDISSKKAAQKSNAIQLSCPSSLTGKSPFVPKDKRESNWLRATVLTGPTMFGETRLMPTGPVLRDWIPEQDFELSGTSNVFSEKDSVLLCAYRPHNSTREDETLIQLGLLVPYNQCTVASHVPHFTCIKKNKSVTSTPSSVEEILIDMDQFNHSGGILVDYDLVSTKQVIFGDEGILQITIIPQTRQIDIKGLRPGKTTLTIKDTLGKTRSIYNVKIVSKGRKTFATDYVSFEIPRDWACLLEGSNYICKSEKPDLKKYAVIIVSAKFRGEIDSLNAYKAHLEKQINPVGPIIEGPVNGHNWVQSLHRASEVRSYLTHYWATVNEDLGMVVSFSVIEDLHQEFIPIISSFASSLRLISRPSQKAPKLAPELQLFEYHSKAYTEYFRVNKSKTPSGGKIYLRGLDQGFLPEKRENGVAYTPLQSVTINSSDILNYDVKILCKGPGETPILEMHEFLYNSAGNINNVDMRGGPKPQKYHIEFKDHVCTKDGIAGFKSGCTKIIDISYRGPVEINSTEEDCKEPIVLGDDGAWNKKIYLRPVGESFKDFKEKREVGVAYSLFQAVTNSMRNVLNYDVKILCQGPGETPVLEMREFHYADYAGSYKNIDLRARPTSKTYNIKFKDHVCTKDGIKGFKRECTKIIDLSPMHEIISVKEDCR